MSRKLYITDDMGLDEALGDIEAENPAAAMLWPWLIPYFDDWGRADASARRIKGKIFPLFASITIELIEEALSLFACHGLITIYTDAEDRRLMAVPSEKWFRYQSHIHASKRTEDKSRYPAPSIDSRCAPSDASQSPAIFREESQLSRDSAQSRETPRDIAENRASPSPSPSTITTTTTTTDTSGANAAPPGATDTVPSPLPLSPSLLVEMEQKDPGRLLTWFRKTYPEHEPALTASLQGANGTVRSQAAYLKPVILAILSGNPPNPLDVPPPSKKTSQNGSNASESYQYGNPL